MHFIYLFRHIIKKSLIKNHNMFYIKQKFLRIFILILFYRIFIIILNWEFNETFLNKNDLLAILDGYRSMINITENFQISESLKIKLMKKCNASMGQPLDVFLNGHQIIENFLFIKKNFSINFFYPNALIDSPEICKHDSTSDTAIMIPILIHSHWSNHLRRKAIRDT